MRAKGCGQSALLLLDIVDLLSRENIPYAIIGAFAASFYGIVRASLDADVIISLTAEDFDVHDLAAALRKDGFVCGYCAGSSDDPLDGVVRINDKYGNQVDLITGIKGMDAGAFGRINTVSLLKHKLHLIGIEDFIAMKIFAGSPKDIDDVRGVLNISRKKVDIKLLKKLMSQYGSKEVKLLERLLKSRLAR